MDLTSILTKSVLWMNGGRDFKDNTAKGKPTSKNTRNDEMLINKMVHSVPVEFTTFELETGAHAGGVVTCETTNQQIDMNLRYSINYISYTKDSKTFLVCK